MWSSIPFQSWFTVICYNWSIFHSVFFENIEKVLIATVSNSTKSQEFQPQLQTYQKLQEVERQEMIHEAEDEEVQLDQDSMDQNN